MGIIVAKAYTTRVKFLKSQDIIVSISLFGYGNPPNSNTIRI
ncbi:hypothetical protein RINTHH_12730 [Richelia intracellularis HH01]|uniref:Uncharacterized protein n=1 Tax=Richelia intracellularis HH01 TaxID=1165094 RepID=M1X0B7_9NOST|nr:hypothetical protein RINTHH_12730 [Richelia intracellularis HH01]